jgi:hypothetical protein
MQTISEEAVRFDPRSAEGLNRGCVCRPLDPDRLRRELEAEPSLAGLDEDIARTPDSPENAESIHSMHEAREQLGFDQ